MLGRVSGEAVARKGRAATRHAPPRLLVPSFSRDRFEGTTKRLTLPLDDRLTAPGGGGPSAPRGRERAPCGVEPKKVHTKYSCARPGMPVVGLSQCHTQCWSARLWCGRAAPEVHRSRRLLGSRRWSFQRSSQALTQHGQKPTEIRAARAQHARSHVTFLGRTVRRANRAGRSEGIARDGWIACRMRGGDGETEPLVHFGPDSRP